MQTLYLLPLMISTMLGFVLVIIIIRNQLAAGARALLILILGCTLWSFGYALEIVSPTIEAKLFWAKFQYFGITTIPLAWYAFSLQRVVSSGWSDRSPKYHVSLWAMPVVTLYLVWTNDTHHLVWEQVQLQVIDSFTLLKIDHGAWFWIYWIFSYCLLLLGTIKLVGGLFTTVRYHRWQLRLILIASLFPWIGNFIYVSGLNPIPRLDWTPFSITLAGFLFTVSLFRYQLVNILPIARQTVFSGQVDSLVVLDLEDCIVDLNPAAQEMIESSVKDVIGSPLSMVFPELASWVEKAGFAGEFQAEIPLGAGPEQRFFDLHISPLKGLFRYPIGRLIVLHDVTLHKHDQARLEQVRAQLEDIVSERTETLRLTIEQLQFELTHRNLVEQEQKKLVDEIKQSREQLQALTFRLQEVRESERRQIATELHDGVGQNLTGLNLNLMLIENQLTSVSCAEDVRIRLDDSLKLLEATSRQVREVMTDLHPPMLDEYGLVSALQWYGSSFAQRAGITAQVKGDEFTPRLPQNVEMAIFRIVQEALNNVAKHAEASRVTISVESSEDTAVVVVEDNGIGFDLSAGREANGEPHWGIINMQQQAASISGNVEIDSVPNQGTRVVVQVRR